MANLNRIKNIIKGVAGTVFPRIADVLDKADIPPAQRTELDAEFQRIENEMMEKELDTQLALHQADVDDRKSAREMYRAGRTWFQNTLAGAIIGGFFGFVCIAHFVPGAEGSQTVDTILYMLSAFVGMILQFYFGGGSQIQKARQMKDAQNTLNGNKG